MALQKWLTDNNYYDPGPEKHKKSHLTFCGYKGGIIYLPENHNIEYEFIKKYAEDFKNGEKLYYVEQRAHIFKYMIDLDIPDDHYWPDKEIIRLASFINSIINEFFEDTFCIVCKSPPKIKKMDNKEVIHSGVHLIWPKIYVCCETAIYLRACILQKITEFDKIVRSWPTILDEVVYIRNGYRMVGSDKMVKKIAENRIYSILDVIDINGSRTKYLERLLGDYVSLIADTSIRYIPISIGNKDGMKPSKIPKWVNHEIVLLNKPKIPKRFCSNDSIELTVLQNFITKYVPEYANIPNLINRVIRYPDLQGNILVTTNTRYCLNLGREHGSCGIYFHIGLRGLTQKCLCPCNNLHGRKNGLCKDFTSKIYKIPLDLTEILFRKEAKFRKEKPEAQGVEAPPAMEAPTKSNACPEDDKKPSEPEQPKSDEKETKKGKKKKIFNNKGAYVPGMATNSYDRKMLEKQCGQITVKLLEVIKKENS